MVRCRSAPSPVPFNCVAKRPFVMIMPCRVMTLSFGFLGMAELWSKIYKYTKVPITPIYGGFPVKLTTYLSDPIPSWDHEVEDLRLKAIAQIQDMIDEHQQLPGNVVRAIKERLEYSNEDPELEEPEDDTIIEEEAVEDEFQSAESICSDGIDDVIDDSGCGSYDEEEDYEDMDTTKMNSQDPIVQLPNGKLVLFSGFSVVRRLSLA